MSRKQKLKARDKVTGKMSRDGLVERNIATGDDVNVSRRIADANLESGKRSNATTLQLDKRPGKTVKKKKQRRIAEHSVKSENAANTNVQPQTAAVIADTPKQADSPIIVQSDTNEREKIRREQPRNHPDSQTANHPHRVPQKALPVNSKPPPAVEQTGQPSPQAGKTANEPRSALKHGDGGKLQFGRDAEPAPASQRKQKPQQQRSEIAEQSDNAADSLPPNETSADTPHPSKLSDAPPSSLKHDAPDTLRFEPQGDEVRPAGKKPKQPRQDRKSVV
jgi:hypothetical protein